MEEYRIRCDPIANPESIVSGPKWRFTILDNRVLRYEWAQDGQFEDRASTFALWRRFPSPTFRVEETEHELQIITSSLHLTYDKERFSPNGLVVSFKAKLTDWGAEWRYGESSPQNLGGTARTLDDVDGRCDMGTGVLSRSGYSNLDDSDSMLFEENGFVTPRRKGDRVDGYLFAYDMDYKGAMESFYAISGHQPSVPRWCLGNWWSRYHAYDDAEYLALMDQFKQNGIPLSVAVIDMDWHWVKESFVPHTGWTGYSWNTNLFPSPKDFTRSLRDRGLKITLNDHPHAGIHEHEDVYDDLAQRLGHDTTHRAPIQFDPTSPKFMHAYFNLVHRKLEEIGCDFWWIDWQQGQQSRVPGFDPLWLLNHFQFEDTKRSNPKSSPVIFSRYAGPGSHRYPIGFSGDTFATWASLQFQPEFTATASNIGFGWWSHDIGGHLPGDRNDECTTRWVQYAGFSPVLRLHSTVSRWMSKEPWLYRHEHMVAMRSAMQYRHRLVPYIHSINASSEHTLPLVQPMYWEFPQRDVAYRFPNQYLFGPSLIVSPIVTPRDPRTNLASSQVWVPPGRHVDIFTGTLYDGDRELDMYRSIDTIPVLAPEGSIIPLDRDAVPTNGCKNPDGFEIIVVVGQNGNFTIIEDLQDDRDQNDVNSPTQRSMHISYDHTSGHLTFNSGIRKTWTFRFLSTQISISAIKVHINNAITADFTISHDKTDTVLTLGAQTNSKISIDLGLPPELTVHDHIETMSRLLRDFQTGIAVKDRIWEIVRSDQPVAIKIGRLLSLGLEKVFYGPLFELLVADSRL
ncbi:hypothetical protein AC578_3948 [Pseudocercospora eumusae]|uniref:DUF5110 domain-containing protein n=1 Tax=Pseudocercospora eumusae TaxID=321146 RepID=A0A139HLN4_9PEZI|nr:hypothetical protein AC578_3948 [Pseudocercospora eumusae]